MYVVEIFRLDKRFPGGMVLVETKRYTGRTLSEVETLEPRRPRYIVNITEA